MQVTRVRRPYWALLAGALILALLLPAASFWQSWNAPLVLSVQLVPQHPLVGQVVHVVVTLRDDAWSSAHQVALRVTADMLTMAMHTPLLAVPPDASGKHYQTSLAFSMVGLWQVQFHLAPSAHAEWNASVPVQVQHALLSWVCNSLQEMR